VVREMNITTKKKIIREGLIILAILLNFFIFGKLSSFFSHEAYSKRLCNEIGLRAIITPESEHLSIIADITAIYAIAPLIYFIVLFIRFWIWLFKYGGIKKLRVETPKVMKLILDKDVLVRVILIMGIVYLGILILKSCQKLPKRSYRGLERSYR
jgi:hypothetical protein